MKIKVLLLLLIWPGMAWTAPADTLKLKNGQVVYGTFYGRSSQGIQFAGTDGRTQIYPYQEVESLNFGPIPPPPQPATPPRRIVAPPGTVLLVRGPSTGNITLR